MKLMTKELARKLPRLYSTDMFTDEGERNDDIILVAKFFTPDSQWTWYVIEGEQRGDDWLFFGYIVGLERELGYFTLSELESVRGPLGLKIERDRYWKPITLGEFLEREKKLGNF